MRDGQQALLSAKTNVVIVAPANKEVADGARGSFLVAVSNNTKRPVVVSPGKIKATTFVSTRKASGEASVASDSKDELHKPTFEMATDAATYVSSYQVVFPEHHGLKVYTYDELAEEEKERAAMQAVAIALGGVGDAMAATNAGYQSGHGTYNTYGSPSGSTFGTYNYSSYNYGAAQAARNAAQARNSARSEQAMAMHSTNMDKLKGTILKEHTLLPGETYGGIVEIDLPSFATAAFSVPVVIDVEAGNETHTFVYRLTKAETN